MLLPEYLKLKGVTRSQFAKLLGISPIHMSNICNGKRNPSLALTRRIIKATDGKVNVADLFKPDSPARLLIKEN